MIMSSSRETMQVNPNWRIGLVTSRFNEPITEALQRGAIARLEELGFRSNQVQQAEVPGAVEIPLAAKWMVEGGCDGVITLGAVIRGETSHYDYVCNSVERGCTELMQSSGRPIVFGVLTTENRQQAEDRTGGKKGHKGIEAVDVLVEMLNLRSKLLRN